jgi:hypothetical protein
VYGAFNYRCFDVLVAQRNAGLEPAIQGFMEIHNHHDACFNGNVEESHVAFGAQQELASRAPEK